jgi:hypothetical protein
MVRYGYGESDFHFRLDGKEPLGEEVILDFHQPAPVRIRIGGEKDGRVSLEKSKDGVVYEAEDCSAEVAGGGGLGLRIPFASLGWRADGEEVSFLVRVIRGGVEVERYPDRGLIEFRGPMRALDIKNWYI